MKIIVPVQTRSRGSTQQQAIPLPPNHSSRHAWLGEVVVVEARLCLITGSDSRLRERLGGSGALCVFLNFKFAPPKNLTILKVPPPSIFCLKPTKPHHMRWSEASV